MTTRFASILLSGVLVAAGLSAQTKTSGTATCKPNPSTPVALTDQPNHSFMVGGAQCTWTKFEVAGVQYKDGVSTDLDEITGDKTSFHGYHVATAANGDMTVSKYQGTGTLKDGKPVGGHGTWTFTSGTGKFKGIKGKGTFKGTANPDGSMTYQIEGEYQLP
jgi:hypothetical protein